MGRDWATLAYRVYKTKILDGTINLHVFKLLFTQHCCEGDRNTGLEMFFLEVDCALGNKKKTEGREKGRGKVVETVSLKY